MEWLLENSNSQSNSDSPQFNLYNNMPTAHHTQSYRVRGQTSSLVKKYSISRAADSGASEP